MARKLLWPGLSLGSTKARSDRDIVTRELNGDFIGVFRCPACHRLAIKAEDSDQWKFYRAEPG